jgi:hypothetical protein
VQSWGIGTGIARTGPSHEERCPIDPSEQNEPLSRDPQCLLQPLLNIRPVMNRQQGRRAVEGVVSEGECLCTSLNERMCAPHALGDHDPGRLNGNHVSITGFVRAYAGTDVHNRTGTSESTRKYSCDSLVGTSIVAIVPSDTVVQRRRHLSTVSELPNVRAHARARKTVGQRATLLARRGGARC